MIETENPKSTETRTTRKGGARQGAGAIPLSPEQKMVAEKISLRPHDWGYLKLFVAPTADAKERTPGHLVRAAIEHLRLSTPNGPDKPFYVREPGAPRPPSTTPAVAREAARRGITKAEQINEMWELWKSQKGEGR